MKDQNVMMFGCIYNLVRLWYVNGLLYGGEGNHCRYFATKKSAISAIKNAKLKNIAHKKNFISLEDFKNN